MSLVKNTTFGGLRIGERDVADAAVEIAPTGPLATWRISLTRPGGGNWDMNGSDGGFQGHLHLIVSGGGFQSSSLARRGSARTWRVVNIKDMRR